MSENLTANIGMSKVLPLLHSGITYNSSTTYQKQDVVLSEEDGSLYMCKESAVTAANPPTSSYWLKVVPATGDKYITSITKSALASDSTVSVYEIYFNTGDPNPISIETSSGSYPSVQTNDYATLRKTNDSLADEYDSSASYPVNSYVIYRGELYSNPEVVTAEDWDEDHWSRVQLCDFIGVGSSSTGGRNVFVDGDVLKITNIL